MKAGTRMSRSAEEEARYEQYAAYLRTERGVASERSRAAYLSAVGRKGRLTRAAREAGRISEGTESLLAMTDPEQVRAVETWWQTAGQDSLKGYTTHMGHWLAFQDRARTAFRRERPPQAELEPPPHRVRLLSVLQAFCAGWGTVRDREELLEAVTGCQYDADCLREHSASFRRLRQDLLDRIDRESEAAEQAIIRTFPGRLVSACRAVPPRILEEHDADLLEDLARRRVAYDDSLLASLETLRAAGRQPEGARDRLCARAFLGLIRAVLLDCDPASRPDDPALEPGAALRDPRLWENGLLWGRLEQGPLSSRVLEVLLRVPEPEDGGLRSRLAGALLHSMLALADQPTKDETGWKRADRWMEEAVVFCGTYWEDLYPALLRPSAGWYPATPELQLQGGPRGSLFHADLLRRQAELLLHMPVEARSESRQLVHLVRIQSDVQLALSILQRLREEPYEALEQAGSPRRLRLTMARLRLCDAEVHRRLGALEREETCLTDVLGLYIRPSRAALADREAFAFLNEEERREIEPRRIEICRACLETYFGEHSAFAARLRLFPGTDDRDYRTEQDAWRTGFAGLLSGPPVRSAPKVRLPLDPEALRDPERFRAVYSGVFDSVLGKNPAVQRTPVELAEFQILASSQTSLMQMNQVVDNLTTLQMLHVPGYRAACRAGIITLSCFGGVDDPRSYLERNLLNPNFRFSSADDFALAGDATEEELQRSCRGIMYRYLNGQARLSDFPSACRAHMEFLAESYRLMFDSYQPSDLRRYHQNPARRYPPRQGSAPQPRTLYAVLRDRLSRLVEEAQRPGSRKDLHRLEAIAAYAGQIGELPDRSSYDRAIDALLQSEPDPILEDLRSVVHQSYFIANGSLSCGDILLTERDPNLILTRNEAPGVTYAPSTGGGMLEYTLRQAWKPGTRENIGWPDICEIALISRELDLRSGGMPLEQRIAQKERETGLVYRERNGSIVADDYTARLSTGERTHVCPAEEDDPSVRLLELQSVETGLPSA